MKKNEIFRKRLEDNKKGLGTGIYCVCSANRTVLEASMLEAKDSDSFLVIESTSNQVNQFGGYTGMKAADFTAYIKTISFSTGFPFEKIILGGDHLGPNVWQGEKAEIAMEKAETLVKSYLSEGFTKIHLDTSMFCLDDEGDRRKPLADEITAERAARLCKACEETCGDTANNNSREKPLYIIGTEVPVPGGSKETEETLLPTKPENIQKTLSAAEAAFKKYGLEEAWERVIAVVAQPGVEFGDNQVFYYNRSNAASLSKALDNSPLVFEAHSTDYQLPGGLKEMVEDHFCILKVGPALTYAYREALFSLAKIEAELSHKIPSPSALEETAETVMKNSIPNYWEKYYHGSEEEKRFARKFSLSDRIRYYWPHRELNAVVEKLLANLSGIEIPITLISQYMPRLYMPLCEGKIGKKPYDLVIAHIRGSILESYNKACGLTR